MQAALTDRDAVYFLRARNASRWRREETSTRERSQISNKRSEVHLQLNEEKRSSIFTTFSLSLSCFAYSTIRAVIVLRIEKWHV